jgi:hypothetical protein
MTTLEQTAYHEAAHTVIGVRLGCKIGERGVFVNGPAQGRADVVGSGLNAIALGLAGQTAEAILAGRTVPEAVLCEHSDATDAMKIASDIGFKDPLSVLQGVQTIVCGMLKQSEIWAQVRKVADALMAEKHLSCSRIADLVAAAGVKS